MNFFNFKSVLRFFTHPKKLGVLCILIIIGCAKGGYAPSPSLPRILVGGGFTTYNGNTAPYVAGLNSDGSLSNTFTPVGTGLNGIIDCAAVDSSGRLIVGGQFTSYNGTQTPYIARLNSDGSLDSTFNATGSGLNNWVLSCAIDSSGRVLVGGIFTSYNGISEPYIARINTDGSLDTTFNPVGTGLNGQVQAIAFDSSGKIVVGGFFTTYNTTTSERYIARLNIDGSLDVTFNPVGTGLNNGVFSICFDSSGKLVVGGWFTTYNTVTSEKYVARLNTDGSLDASFNPVGTGINGNVAAVMLDASGRVIVVGQFTAYNGTPERWIARLNAGGGLDTTFNPVGSGLSSQINPISMDLSGKFLVGGTFTSYNGTPQSYVARLNSDGSLDTTFNPVGTGLNARVYSLISLY